jgi:hypothetical protein
MQTTVAEALHRDKERVKAAALKNLAYIKKKELQDIEKRLQADEEETALAALPQPAAKRARVSRAGIGTGAQTRQNTSVYVTGLPATVKVPHLGNFSLVPQLGAYQFVLVPLENVFSVAGRVRKVKLYQGEQGQAKGDALITFMKAGSVSEAIRQV